MYNRIKDLSDVDNYSKESYTTFYKWSEFFNDVKFIDSCAEIIKGLIFRVVLLQSYINHLDNKM
jgi:hypothetical protein